MKHPERVEDYLGHIAEAIARATSYVQPLQGIEAFRQNPLVQDGIVRNIEIIGEATTQINRMAPDFIAQHPELPWRAPTTSPRCARRSSSDATSTMTTAPPRSRSSS